MNVLRNTIFLLGILLLGVVSVSAQTSRKSRQTREEYIQKYMHIAIDHMERYGIPASITMAQGILESDAGNSWLSNASNNHFGIKCKKGWTGKKVYYDDDAKGECFRAYSSVEESYMDHAEFLDRSPRYESLFSYPSDDYKRWAKGLKAAGYATAPDYAERLIRIIEESHLYLLDKEDGARLYASQIGVSLPNEEEHYFVDESTSERAVKVDPDNFRVTINAHEGYNVYATNQVFYILAKENDTFENIAKKFRLSARNLRKFNDITDPKSQPMMGEVVYIERKRKRWMGSTQTHQCRQGETIYAVGQLYGIRSRSIQKMNHLKKNEELKLNQILRIK